MAQLRPPPLLQCQVGSLPSSVGYEERKNQGTGLLLTAKDGDNYGSLHFQVSNSEKGTAVSGRA